MSDTNKNPEDIFDELSRHLAEMRRTTEVSARFSTLQTNAERVDFAYELLDGARLLPALVLDVKSNELAGKMRQKGNERFKARKNAEAMEFYTQSIAAAEDGSEHLGLAFANRSAVLFERGFYAECLMDIDLAFKNSYPENLRPKLLTRQEKARQMKPKQLLTNYFEPIPKIPEKFKNKLIQSAADSIQIKDTEGQGRHVVATRNISAGEILAIEKPFCRILIEQFYNHCHECLRLCYNLIPCTDCTQALYCTEDCKKNAVYHRYECNILATVRKMGMDKLKLLPLKIALIVKDQYTSIKEISNLEEDFYRSDRYREIHNLVANTSSRSVPDLLYRATTSAIIFHLIKKFTDFFETEDEEAVFKELVMLHMQTGACNFHEISELAENGNIIYEPEEIGAGAFSFLSMFNHRCSPNVVRDCHGSVIVVRALGSIKKGEQCYDNYGYHHAVMSKTDRRAKLKKQYFFDCNCEVCVDDWPLYLYLPRIESRVFIRDDDIVQLQLADVEVAKRILAGIVSNFKELERVKPNRNLAEMQEIVKQCFAILGNVRRTL